MKISPVNMDARKNLDLQVGDTVRVYQKIEEKGKVRLQPFDGLVLARKHGTENGATFTVRRVSDSYGVEKIFPLYSPVIDRIEILKRSKVRRSKLYNIRRQALKKISKRMKMMFIDIKSDESLLEETPEEETTDTEAPVEENKEETPEEKVTEEVATEEVKEEAPSEEPKEEEKKEEEVK